MNKNIILLTGIMFSLVTISVVLMTDDDIKVFNLTIENRDKSSEKQKVREEIDIDYRAEKSVVPKKIIATVHKKKREREKFLETRTYDRSKKFEIALINKNQDLAKTSKAFTTLRGKIDGKSFFLKVPKHLIEEGSGVTELRITDLTTNDVSSVSAAFIDDMRDSTIHQSISIDSNNIENYEQSSVKQIVPPRPGERVN